MANKRIYELGTTSDNTGRFFALDESGLPSALKIAADAYYLKTETDALLASYYTKGEVDTILTGYVTAGDLSTALSSYYTKTEIDTKFTDYYTMIQIDNAFTLYYTKAETDALLAGYVTLATEQSISGLKRFTSPGGIGIGPAETNTITEAVGGDMTFFDTVTGAKTLAELAAGGGGGYWTSDTNGINYQAGGIGIGGVSAADVMLTITGSLTATRGWQYIVQNTAARTWADFPTALPVLDTLIGKVGTVGSANDYSTMAIGARGNVSGAANSYAVLYVRSMSTTDHGSEFGVMLRGVGVSDYRTVFKADYIGNFYFQTENFGDITHRFLNGATAMFISGYYRDADVYSIQPGNTFAAATGFNMAPSGRIGINQAPGGTYEFSVTGRIYNPFSDGTAYADDTTTPYGGTNFFVVKTTPTNLATDVAAMYIRLNKASYVNITQLITRGEAVTGSATAFVISCRNASNRYVEVFEARSAGSIYLKRFTSAAASLDVQYNATSKQMYYVSSDAKLKENVRAVEDSLSFIRELAVKEFDRRDGSAVDEVGLIAQDVQKLRPDYVVENNDELAIKNGNIRWHVLRAVQQLAEQIDSINEKLQQ